MVSDIRIINLLSGIGLLLLLPVLMKEFFPLSLFASLIALIEVTSEGGDTPDRRDREEDDKLSLRRGE